MSGVREVFIDTSYLIAALSPSDRHHEAALRLKTKLAEALPVTTNHIVGESWTFARRRFGHAAAARLVQALRGSGRYRIVHASAELEAEVHRWLRDHPEREYSFVDGVSFAVMRERRILDALAFDDDFAAAGFRPLAAL